MLGLAIGVVATVLVAAVLLFTDVLGWGNATSDAAAVDTRPLTMPETLPGLTTQQAAAEAKGMKPDALQKMTARQANTERLTTAAYQAAYGGAAAGYQSYSTADLESLVSVIAVRADSPGMTAGPVYEAADLGMAVPMREVVAVGDVDCQIQRTRGVAAGEQEDPDDALTTDCQRTGSGLTVLVQGSQFTGDEGRQQLAAITTAAWQALSTG